MKMLRRLTLALLALGAAAACQAGIGLAELPGLPGDGPVTVFYPSSSADEPVQRGPFQLQLAWQGTPVRGNGRLIVITHGSGGNPWVHTDLARAMVAAGFVVALPEHAGDNSKDPSTPGPESWKRRPAEVSRAIDTVAQDTRLAPLLALDKVGVFGGSAGGHTALSLAGGAWSPARFRQHCEAHIAEDFSSCVGFITRLHGNLLDGLKKWFALAVIRHRFGDETAYTHQDPRIQATVASVPFAADFDMATLATPRIALGLVTAGMDVNQVPRFHSSAVLAACQDRCTHVAHLPGASHGAMLSPMPPLHLLNDVQTALLGDPPGFDRKVLPDVDARIVAFFAQHLQPLQAPPPLQAAH
ncbi:alpha/beta hydrolase family protein [Acidovorax sp. ACV01]|uniref:alpha/beta hydrolase family protein n=1 Tax=Acidovorax sp. ACV01 TaxID=2769311 RepID=UPI00351BF75B